MHKSKGQCIGKAPPLLVALVNLNFITNANKFVVFLFLLIKLYFNSYYTILWPANYNQTLYTPRVFCNRLNTKSITLNDYL